MLFNSWAFIVFLGVVTVLYYCAGRRNPGAVWQVGLLLLASLFFYAWETPALVLLLVFSLVMNVAFAVAISTSRERGGRVRAWVAGGVSANLVLLALFKYAGLLAPLVLSATWLADHGIDPNTIPLPIGISFYTFQAISLLVDLKVSDDPGVVSLRRSLMRSVPGQPTSGRSRARAARDIAFYVAFFPQLVAGPIVKASFFMGQIGHKYIADVHWPTVFRCLVTGFFLKMVIADNLKDVTRLLGGEPMESLGRIDLVVLLYGYSFQIFADFAGYSLIAIGLGALFGYRFPINFNFPYIAGSITDFWRRWHISLSAFLREYLYVPLGGNRRGAARTYVNLGIVMVLGGLWHGAAWSYAVWGAAHGVLLALERWHYGRAPIRRTARSSWRRLPGIVLTFHLVSVLWLLFLLPDFSQVMRYFQLLATTDTLLLSFQHVYIVALYALPVLLYHADALVRESSPKGIWASHLRARCELPVLCGMLFLIIVNSGTAGEFIYFQF